MRCRIAYIIYRIMVLAFVEILFEKQKKKEQVDVALYVANAMFLPSPNLWGDIIEDGNRAVLLDEVCYLEVEAWIIDQD